MNKAFITKSIPRSAEPMIEPLMKGYSKELGIPVKQGQAILLALTNEYNRLFQKD